MGTNLRYQYYDLAVTDAGLADLRVLPAAELPTRVDILDDSGRLIAEDVQSGGSNRPVLRQQLAAGSYYVLVAAAQQVDYTLQFKFNPGPPATCPSLDLKIGTQTGSFDGASSCRSFNLMQDTYRVSLGTPNAMSVAITTGGSLVLSDAKDNVLTQSTGSILAETPPVNGRLGHGSGGERAELI